MSSYKKTRIEALAKRLRAGDPRALGRALTVVESGGDDALALTEALAGAFGEAHIVGFTGPPGAGKSTLLNALIHEWRREGRPVAVLAVDPVSPVSGGAVLGDRTRMGAHSLDDGVFIRSVSARGHLGGLCEAAHDMADIMDAAGWPLILIETVGAGQSETEITQVADLSVVISAPGLGDELQAIKAGILEIGDLLVVNKADRDDADETAKHLEAMLSLRSGAKRNISVLRVSATTGRGVSRLKDEINQLLETTGVAVGADRKRKRDARKLRLAVLRFASRISAGIPDEDFGSMRPEEFDRAIERSLAFLSTEIDD
ncbi:LAO/AO transport system kinase [Roseovarius sp. MBR-154]|jgi:LAO/AO transport system ATPase